MSNLRTAALRALEAWDGGDTEWFKRAYSVMDALKEALVEPVQEPDDKADSIRWQLCLLAQTEEFSDDVRNQIGRGVWLIDRLTEAALAEPVQEPVADRAAFERHAERLGYSVDPDTREGREGGYWSSHTQLMWLTWQAAMAQRSAQPVQEPVAQAMQDAVVYGMGIFHGGKRIDPDSIYKKAETVHEPVAFKDAPERIWLQACDDDHCEVPFHEHDEITWWTEQQNPLDVQYVRADLASPPQRPAEPAGVVTSMVKGGVTWHIWPDQMPDGTTLYAAAPIIKPEIKEDKPFGYFRAEPFGWTDCAPTDEGAIPLYERPQAQQFLYNAWADEQIQKEKK